MTQNTYKCKYTIEVKDCGNYYLVDGIFLFLFLFTGDLNITFADSNRLLEEAKDSHVLSAALIAALSFGILFFFAVLVLIGKRCFDSWQRRHYSRVDYLVNGMYN